MNAKGSGSEGENSPPHSSEDPGLHEPAVAPPQSNMVLRKRIRKIKQGMKRYNSQLSLMRRDLRGCKQKIAEQQKQIVEYASRLDDNDKKSEETSRKFSTLLQVFTKVLLLQILLFFGDSNRDVFTTGKLFFLFSQELNKCKTELQYWRSKSPAIPVCGGCGQSMPVPTEDLQALANQGVIPDVFGLDFIPIAEAHSPTQSDSAATTSSSSSSSCHEMAPPKAPISTLTTTKRKLINDEPQDATKKPRRTAKSRQTKRLKV